MGPRGDRTDRTDRRDSAARGRLAVTAVSLRGGRDATWPDDVRTVALDRDADGALAAALGDDCDVLVDMVGFHGVHARQLTALTGRIGAAVVVSSGAVYTDGEGRGFDTAGRPGGDPRYPVPIPEVWTTVEPGDSTYATRKVLLERELLSAGKELPVTVLRAAPSTAPAAGHRASCTSSSGSWTAGAAGYSRTEARASSIPRTPRTWRN